MYIHGIVTSCIFYICSYFQTCFVLLMEEILHQLIGRLSHYLQGFGTIPSGCLGFLNHQQVGIVGVLVYVFFVWDSRSTTK